MALGIESAALGALLVLPLLATPGEPVAHSPVAIPPYRTYRSAKTSSAPQLSRTPVSTVCLQLRPAPIRLPNHPPADGGVAEAPPDIESGPSRVDPMIIGIPDVRTAPLRPAEPHRQTRIRTAKIDAAWLLHRVEPTFPPLARQIRRSGRVELHAIISTDGRVLSLEVVGGDPLFAASALEAVRQWRYKPTYLDGEPVEIDTFITVVYTLEPH